MRRQIMVLGIRCLFVSFFLFAILTSPSKPLAAPYYEGKVITLVVTAEAGGTPDLVARIFAKYLPKYIPGKPNVIVQNIPGGGGRTGANYIYSATPDGLTIGVTFRSLPFAQLLDKKTSGIKFDLRKFSYIGSPIVQSQILAIRADLPYKTFDENPEGKGNYPYRGNQPRHYR